MVCVCVCVHAFGLTLFDVPDKNGAKLVEKKLSLAMAASLSDYVYRCFTVAKIRHHDLSEDPPSSCICLAFGNSIRRSEIASIRRVLFRTEKQLFG